jgi:hypothetical protein
VVERFTQSLARFRDDLNPGLEDIPALDLEDADPHSLQFWGEDGGRQERTVHVDEEDDDSSSSDESEHEDDEEDEDDDDDDGHVFGKGKEFDLPGHR